MRGYKVECPWYDANEEGPEICSGDKEGLGREVKELKRREEAGECEVDYDDE